MAQEQDIKQMVEKIKAIRQNAEELKAISSSIQAVDRNVDRILASVKMLEINITEVASILYEKR